MFFHRQMRKSLVFPYRGVVSSNISSNTRVCKIRVLRKYKGDELFLNTPKRNRSRISWELSWLEMENKLEMEFREKYVMKNTEWILVRRRIIFKHTRGEGIIFISLRPLILQFSILYKFLEFV